ncbi:lipopolysaccharide assembly protein LapA domain-containing protein [Pseudomonadota bacterium]
MYRIVFIVVAVLAVALGLLIGTLNSDTVSIDLLWIQLQWPLGLLLLCIFAVGLISGLLVCWFFGIVPLKARLRKARSKES